jgi:hypothetical protein
VSVRITTYERSTLVNDEKYIGLDVHQASIVVAVMDSTGKLVMESILETKATTILSLIITRAMNYRSTVHFSTSCSTTRNSFRKNGTLLSCRHSHSGLRHFFDNFGECRFGRLLFCFCFSLSHTSRFHESGAVYRSILIMYSESKRGYRHSVALKPSRSVDTHTPKPEQL